MATAVCGTGPTYVFLVMEALIDAAVHLGFPRHIAHDLVIETLEGSTLFAKQSGMHPAELRNMVTSPGGTSAAALHELESGRLRTVLSEAVWAAYRRTVELGDQLEASVGAGRRTHGPGVDDRRRCRVAPRRDEISPRPPSCAAGRHPRGRPARAGPRPVGRRGRAVGPAAIGLGRPRRRGLAPARCGTVRCRRPGLVAGRARRAHRGLAGARRSTTPRRAIDDRARGRPTTTSTTATSTASTSAVARRGRPMPSDEILEPARRRRDRALLDLARRLAGRARSAVRRAVGLGLPCAARPLPRPPRDHRAVDRRASALRQADGDPFVADPRPADLAGFVAQDAAIAADFDRADPAASRPTAGRRRALTPGWTLRDHVDHLADWAEEGARAIEVFARRGHWLADPDEGIDAWNERHGRPLRDGSGVAATLARYDAAAGRAARGRRRADRSTTCARPTAGAGPTTASTATSASTSRCSVRGARRQR